MKDLRLDKFLTEMGKGSRSQVKTYISKGRVTVNGEIIKRPEYKISPENDIVNLEGEKVNYSQWEYYMLNKPAGCVSATEDKHFPTVISFIEDAAASAVASAAVSFFNAVCSAVFNALAAFCSFNVFLAITCSLLINIQVF